MKYPKLWNNSSAVGESLVRSLQRIDTPFLSAHAPGVEANKMNRFSEVKSGEVFRYFTYDNKPGGPFNLRGASSYRRGFRKLSTHRKDDQFANWYMALASAGRTVFQIMDLGRDDGVVISAKNGICQRARTQFSASAGHLGNASFVHGAVSNDGSWRGANSSPLANVGVGFQQSLLSSGFTTAVLLKLYPNSQPIYRARALWSVPYEDMRADVFAIFRAGPDRLYAFTYAVANVDKLMRKGQLHPDIHCLMCSNDNGETWFAVPDGNLVTLDKDQAPVPLIPISVINGVAGSSGDLVAFIVNNMWQEQIALAGVWLTTPSGIFQVTSDDQIKAAMGIEHLMAGSNTVGFHPVRMSDHILVLSRVYYDGDYIPKLMKFSLSGELLSTSDAPLPAKYTGFPSVTHDGKLLCPMYCHAADDDEVAGVYAWTYNDTDGWVKNGLVIEIAADRYSEMYADPERYVLPACSQIEYVLTSGGNAAPTYPAAPELGKAE